jgi:hypothetical protein
VKAPQHVHGREHFTRQERAGTTVRRRRTTTFKKSMHHAPSHEASFGGPPGAGRRSTHPMCAPGALLPGILQSAHHAWKPHARRMLPLIKTGHRGRSGGAFDARARRAPAPVRHPATTPLPPSCRWQTDTRNVLCHKWSTPASRTGQRPNGLACEQDFPGCPASPASKGTARLNAHSVSSPRLKRGGLWLGRAGAAGPRQPGPHQSGIPACG